MKRYILKTLKEVQTFFGYFNTEVFAFDTETTDLKYMDLDIEGISFCDGRVSGYIDLILNPEREEILDYVHQVFNSAHIIVAHNITFDLQVLHKVGIRFAQEPELYDTMVADHLIDENRRHGLKFLAETLLGKDTTSWVEIKDHQSIEFYKYACNDAIWTWELMQYQKPIMNEQRLITLMREIEMPFQWVLLDMAINGFLIDKDKLKQTARNIQIDLVTLNKKLIELAGKDMNFNSSQQLCDLLFNTLGLPVMEKTPSGKPSVGASAMAKLKDTHPIIEVLLEYKRAQKLLSAYFADDAQIMSNIDSDGRVRPRFMDTGTATGRLSCNSPNLQQLPRPDKDPYHTRDVFIASPGYTMITCDYGGQEICVAAEVSRDPTLIDALKKGQDMHLKIANQFFELGIPDECLYTTHPDYEMYKSKFKSERTKAKTITFGLMYGKGAYGFSKDFGVSEEEAQEIVDKYFAGMPKLKESIDKAHQAVKRSGTVTSLVGRKRRFQPNVLGYYPNGAYRQAYNFLIQGYSADMLRQAMVAVRRTGRANRDWDLRPLGTVHDEAIYEVRTEYLKVAERAIKDAFESAVSLVVPVVGETSTGHSYEEAK